ncbi:uncharacterized protein An02g12530 [Aspergillus niger]|uniref:Contig An02c0400, genomic contig n=2 Tax=Aspergillus niger TaxID=5061 RepID=A2QEX3_ASPNC|nr:uncharacterized protein An02g12530 [Aspergillus niger]CAK44523.1 unnamed protein product [Aspergillus niger]
MEPMPPHERKSDETQSGLDAWDWRACEIVRDNAHNSDANMRERVRERGRKRRKGGGGATARRVGTNSGSA